MFFPPQAIATAGHDNGTIMQSLETRLDRPLTSMERVALIRCINKNMRPTSRDETTSSSTDDSALRLPVVTLKHVRDTMKLILEEQLHRLQPYLDLYTHCYSW